MPNSYVNARKTHCKHGHEFNEENTIWSKEGHRNCRPCRNRLSKESKARIRSARQAKRARKLAKRILGMPESFWSKTSVENWGYSTNCLVWTGTLASNGYGVLDISGRQYKAHRLAYEAQVREIPEGLVIDHLCRNPKCVNVTHMEPVENGTNVLRGISFSAVNKRKTHCIKGHTFTPENTRLEKGTLYRVCLKCKRARGKVSEARRKARRREERKKQ